MLHLLLLLQLQLLLQLLLVFPTPIDQGFIYQPARNPN